MKMMRTIPTLNIYKLCITLLVFSLILVACSSENNPIIHQGKNGEIYPLAIGNKWEYSRTIHEPQFNIHSKDTISREIYSSYLKNGVEWFGIAYSFFQISKQSDGIWVQHTQSPNEPTPSLMYKYPTFSGDSYSHWKVISIEKIIKIGLGYFRTIHYRFLLDSETNEYEDFFLCPGIGIIKYHLVRKDNSGKYYISVDQELINYTVN